MPPIVSAGPERRSRAERRETQDRIARIERILAAQGLTPKEEPEAAGKARKRPAGTQRANRKRTNPK